MRKNKGFTLLEVVISILIIATVLTVLLTTHNHSLDMLNEGTKMVQATLLAKQKLTELEVSGFPSVGTENGVFDEEGNMGFAWQQNVIDTPFENIRQVDIDVTWGEKSRDGVRLTSYFVEN